MTGVATEEEVAYLDELAATTDEFADDPYGHVMWAYPWGEAGTELEDKSGPDDWQTEELQFIRDELRRGGDLGALILLAVRSGHGTGKTALFAWIAIWAITTRRDAKGVLTAMSGTQLRTKTWAELAKWYSLFIAREFWDLQATSLIPKGVSPADQRKWRLDGVTWSVVNTSAFAGLHNEGKRIVVLFDEASEIEDIIWEITRGALTDANTQIIWIVMGQPTQVTGEFFRCFVSGEWRTRTIDSRTSKFTNKKLLQEWIDRYQIDSDFVRVRVLGLPPRSGITNFISLEDVQHARRRNLEFRNQYTQYPKRMGVDPARFGDDKSVVVVRQGPKILGLWDYSGLDGPNLASRIVTEIWPLHSDISGCAVDAIGIGASCVDALARVNRTNSGAFPLLPVNVALNAWLEDEYHNLSAELWGRMRDWMKTADIPDKEDLQKQLVERKYGFDGRSRIQLESKDDMKRRGLDSPDMADAIALTFYEDTIVKSAANRVKKIERVAPRVVMWKGRAIG